MKMLEVTTLESIQGGCCYNPPCSPCCGGSSISASLALALSLGLGGCGCGCGGLSIGLAVGVGIHL